MDRQGAVQVVRGRLDPALADELLAFWSQRAALTGAAARRRLAEVVCVLRLGGALAGTCSVYAAEVALVGRRRFWIYRSLLDPDASAHAPEMISATFAALGAEFDGSAEAPIGLCLLLDDSDLRRHHPEARWSDPPMVYAGYLADGRQVRIGYFDGAEIARPGEGLEPGPLIRADGLRDLDPPFSAGYRIELFSEQGDIGAEDLIDLWTREGVLDAAEARRRIEEVLLVATDPERRVAGVCTTYLQRSEQLRAELWNARVFVAKSHRRSHLAHFLAVISRDHHARRYAEGLDRRGIGMAFEVESEALKRLVPAVWPRTGFTFVGRSGRGAHLRVWYFPDAPAPAPPRAPGADPPAPQPAPPAASQGSE